MYSSRRLPVYVLHDGSADAHRGFPALVEGLRSDPYALETVWLSFISLAGSAKQTVPLTEIEAIGNVGAAEVAAGAPDLRGGLSLFESDVNANLRKTTATTKGDWRPILVLFLGANPQGDLSVGLEVINGRRCGYRLAFVGAAVSPLSRARLTDGGFDLIDVADGVVEPGPDWGSGRAWAEVLYKAITQPNDWRAAPAPAYPLPPPPVVFDSQVNQNARSVADDTPSATERGDVSRPQITELKPGNLFTVDLGNLSTDGRLTRRGLFGYYVLNFVLMAIAAFISILSTGLAFGLLTIGFWIFLIGLIKRAHDVGLSGWFVLVPFLNLWLLFAPGQEGANKFGPNPRAAGDGDASGAR
jgi:uncharacterized protein YegL